MAKYKEQITKVEADLKATRSKEKLLTSRISELEDGNQPYKEKILECEKTIKRLGNENRSLEVRLKHAERQMKDMRKQLERESFGVSLVFLYRISDTLSSPWNLERQHSKIVQPRNFQVVSFSFGRYRDPF